ncbi:MAG: 1-(5-phosphoribosyl)-5-[(5-phosphoribosylamino)methylideneamino]imidazole-4-carboxamide isomerase [Alphaproteobacteria bacterium]|nr:1-(5-phosphoribosyl)-5-[(5-phosphoribosylamino)methylideneamino]imidazole-4-carboxamide isomerase [Alphaproteobacteria bacterium]
MILYPAIDLKDGQCVRLLRGAMDQATVFSTSPADQAKRFAEAGAIWLHLVDLNGAFTGKPVNAEAVREIRASVSLPVQLGGGIRDLATIEMWLSEGITRVILGTVAVKNPALVHEACRKFPGRIVVGIDARKGKVAVEGWAETSELTAVDLARQFEDAGAAALVYTDIDRDGVMEGVNVVETAELAKSVTIPVIASGGVASVNDLEMLYAERRISGVIIGRALYEGAVDLKEAINRFH